MELKYRRRMRMPVWSLPGFLSGRDGEIGSSQNTTQTNNNNLTANNLDGTTFNGNVNMNLGYDNQSAYQKWIKSGGSDYSGFNKVGQQSIPQLSQPTAPNINIGDINAQMNQQKQIDWSSNSIPLQQQNNGNIFGPNNQEVWDKSAGFTKNTALINGVQQNGGGKSIDWGQIGQSAIQFAGSVANSFGPVKTEGDLQSDAGYTISNGAGYQWNKQNQINRTAEMRELNRDNTSRTFATAAAGVGLGAGVGAAIGGVAGPIGAAAGAIIGLGLGLIGGSHRKAKMRRRIYNAQQNIIRKNSWENASRQTDYLVQDWNNQYGSSYDDSLYSAKDGKDPGNIINQNASIKLNVKEFNRKLTLPNMKQNNDVQ